MKIKQRKLLVFFINFAAFFSIAIIQSLQGNNAEFSQLMMLLNGAAYIGGNVWNSFVKSKHFQEGLVDR